MLFGSDLRKQNETIKKNGKLCEQCGGLNLKAHLITCPIKVGTKQINVQRVSVKECMDCHFIKPTKAGQDKIERCMMMYMSLLNDVNSRSLNSQENSLGID